MTYLTKKRLENRVILIDTFGHLLLLTATMLVVMAAIAV